MQFMTYALASVALATATVTDDEPAAPSDQVALINAEKDRINAEKDRITAEKDRLNAQADLARARITSLGLPSFEGKTELSGTAGQMEAMQLATGALAIAAAEISARAKALKSDGQGGGRPLILLGQSEVLDFGVVGSMTAEIESLTDQLTPLLPKPPVGRLMPPVAGIIAGISAVAGLFRSETVVSPADFTQIDDAMLVRAIAKNMKDVAIIPSAAIASPPHVAGRDDLLGKLKKATELSFRIRQERDALAAIDKPNAAQTARLSDMEAVLKRFDAFYTRVTTADANGAVPIAAAARLESIQGQAGNVLRVHVDRGGGTLTNSKNIATIFGDDPVRISGALVASYTVTDPQNGSILGGGVINCRTAVARLRNVQEGHFLVRDQAGVRTRVKGDAPRAICAIE